MMLAIKETLNRASDVTPKPAAKPCTKRASSHILYCSLSFSLLMCPRACCPIQQLLRRSWNCPPEYAGKGTHQEQFSIGIARNTIDLHCVVTTLGTISAWIQSCTKPAHTTTCPGTHRSYQRYSRLPDISLPKFRGISKAMSHDYAA